MSMSANDMLALVVFYYFLQLRIVRMLGSREKDLRFKPWALYMQ